VAGVYRISGNVLNLPLAATIARYNLLKQGAAIYVMYNLAAIFHYSPI
jgi:hypothetical protein